MAATGSPQAGIGMVGTVGAVAMFLTFLFLAVQVMLNLYATSVVSAVSYDAARSVASDAVDHDDPGATASAQRDAETDARQALGRYADRVEAFDWSGSDGDVVRLRVRATNPRVLLGLDGAVGLDTIDRRVTLRVERPR